MALHTEDALACTSIAQVFNLPLAVATLEAVGTERLIAGQDREVFDFVPACAAAVGAIIANEGAITKKEEVGVGIEEGAACVATEAVDVPSVTSWEDALVVQSVIESI